MDGEGAVVGPAHNQNGSPPARKARPSGDVESPVAEPVGHEETYAKSAAGRRARTDEPFAPVTAPYICIDIILYVPTYPGTDATASRVQIGKTNTVLGARASGR